MRCFFCLLGIEHDYMSLITKPIASINQMYCRSRMNKTTETASISGNQKDPACHEEPCEKLLQSGDVAKVLGGHKLLFRR